MPRKPQRLLTSFPESSQKSHVYIIVFPLVLLRRSDWHLPPDALPVIDVNTRWRWIGSRGLFLLHFLTQLPFTPMSTLPQSLCVHVHEEKINVSVRLTSSAIQSFVNCHVNELYHQRPQQCLEKRMNLLASLWIQVCVGGRGGGIEDSSSITVFPENEHCITVVLCQDTDSERVRPAVSSRSDGEGGFSCWVYMLGAPQHRVC